MERSLVAVLLQPRIKVASHAPMREGIGTVGGDVNLNEPVALQVIILSGGRTYDCILGQNDDAVVTGANTNLVLGTNHTVGFDAAQFRLLDDELLIAVVEHTAQIGYDDLLACSHVGSTTDNLRGFAFS